MRTAWQTIPRALFFVAGAGAVITLTTLPRGEFGMRTVVRTISRLAGQSPRLAEAIETGGHIVLFFALALVLYWALRGLMRFSFAFSLTLLTCIGVAAATEIAQRYAAGRTPSIGDLVANLLGLFMAATLISLRRR